MSLKYRFSAAIAIFDPLQVHQTEGKGSDARCTVVIVFIYVQVEGGVTIHIGWAEAGPQRFLHGLVGQPLLQFGRAAHIVDDTLWWRDLDHCSASQ